MEIVWKDDLDFDSLYDLKAMIEDVKGQEFGKSGLRVRYQKDKESYKDEFPSSFDLTNKASTLLCWFELSNMGYFEYNRVIEKRIQVTYRICKTSFAVCLDFHRRQGVSKGKNGGCNDLIRYGERMWTAVFGETKPTLFFFLDIRGSLVKLERDLPFGDSNSLLSIQAVVSQPLCVWISNRQGKPHGALSVDVSVFSTESEFQRVGFFKQFVGYDDTSDVVLEKGARILGVRESECELFWVDSEGLIRRVDCSTPLFRIALEYREIRVERSPEPNSFPFSVVDKNFVYFGMSFWFALTHDESVETLEKRLCEYTQIEGNLRVYFKRVNEKPVRPAIPYDYARSGGSFRAYLMEINSSGG
jgi:hypothetical protein